MLRYTVFPVMCIIHNDSDGLSYLLLLLGCRNRNRLVAYILEVDVIITALLFSQQLTSIEELRTPSK